MAKRRSLRRRRRYQKRDERRRQKQNGWLDNVAVFISQGIKVVKEAALELIDTAVRGINILGRSIQGNAK